MGAVPQEMMGTPEAMPAHKLWSETMIEHVRYLGKTVEIFGAVFV